MQLYKVSVAPLKWAAIGVVLLNSLIASARVGALSMNPSGLAFGTLNVGTSLAQTVTISNTGIGNVNIASISISGAAFAVSGLTLPMGLAPGQSAMFQVVFTPSIAGGISGSITFVRTNGSTLGTLALSGTGAATDTMPPAVSVTSPANGATLSGTVTLSASASDNVGVVGVQFFVGSTAIGAEVTAPPYSVNWVTTTASNGAGYVITARARDAAGNTTTSAGVTATVSNASAPAVQHSAALNWVASPSVIVGYYVYRAAQSGGPYSRVSTSVDPSTAYTDTTVVGGQIYYYVVTSVDASSVESGYSNETVATIPF